MMKLLLIFSLFLPAASVWAQFDEDKDSAASEPEVKNIKPKVRRDDIKALKQALADDDEKSVIKAVAVILGKDPNHLETLNSLAVFHFSKKRLGLAKIILNRALAKHADEPSLHNNLGIVYLAEKDIRTAIASFRKALRLKGNYKPGLTNLGSIYLEYNDYRKSVSALEEGYDSIRSDLRRGDEVAARIANNYALSLNGLGKSKKARRIFEAIEEGGNRNASIFLNYAILLVDILKDGKAGVKIISKLRFMTDNRRILKKADELDKRVEL